MTISSHVSELLKRMIEAGEDNQILETLLTMGVTHCVAVDFANEPKRRAVLARRRKERKLLRESDKCGPKGESYRRIIRLREVGNRELFLHATKGWRSYRKQTSFA